MKSFALAFSTLITLSVSAQTVQDGYSIIRGDGVRVRLYGIDAPEKDQPYGKEARKVLKQYMPLVAKMKEYDEDRYGRFIVELFTEDNKSINAAMICQGAAWWYEYYAPDRPQFKQCQEDAQKNNRANGLLVLLPLGVTLTFLAMLLRRPDEKSRETFDKRDW